MSIIIKVILIIVVILGWFISQADQYEYIRKIIAPKYAKVVSVIDQMHRKGYVVKEGEVGFTELAILLKKYINGTPQVDLTYVRTIGWGTSFIETAGSGQEIKSSIELEIGIKNQASPISGKIIDIRGEAKKQYLPHIVLYGAIYGAIVFGVGIILQIILIAY